MLVVLVVLVLPMVCRLDAGGVGVLRGGCSCIAPPAAVVVAEVVAAVLVVGTVAVAVGLLRLLLLGAESVAWSTSASSYTMSVFI
jgi:hypothetical protein